MDKFKLIKEFSKELTSTLELEELAKAVNNFSVARLGAESSSIIIAGRKYSSGKSRMLDRIEEKTFQYIAKVRKMINISNPSAEYMLKDIEGIGGFSLNVVSLPLLTKQRFLGSLNLYFSGKPDDDFIDFLNLFAELSSSSIMNSIAYKSIESDSLTDKLTGLQNRRSFDRKIKEMIEECASKKEPVSVMMIDIDNFKDYNDKKGHQKGDEALAQIGREIAALAGKESAFRYGGEEFAVIARNKEAKPAFESAEKIRKGIEQSCGLTASIGIITCMNSSCPGSVMVKEADSALYRAKKSGKNIVSASVIIDKSLAPVDIQKASELGKRN